MSTVTKTQVVAALQTLAAVAEAIRELGSVPSGHLYAQLMPSGMTLSTYQAIIGKLRRAGLITESNNLLTWVAYTKEEEEQLGVDPKIDGEEYFDE